MLFHEVFDISSHSNVVMLKMVWALSVVSKVLYHTSSSEQHMVPAGQIILRGACVDEVVPEARRGITIQSHRRAALGPLQTFYTMMVSFTMSAFTSPLHGLSEIEGLHWARIVTLLTDAAVILLGPKQPMHHQHWSCLCVRSLRRFMQGKRQWKC